MSTKLHRLDVVAGGIMALIAVVLAAAVLSSLSTTERALEAVDRGSAISLAAEIERTLRLQRARPDAATLQRVLTQFEGKGLRYLRVGGVLPQAEAGQAELSFADADTDMVRREGRIRLRRPLPPPRRGHEGRPGRAPGPRPDRGPDGRLDARPPGRAEGQPPELVLEMHNASSAGLLKDAQRATAVGILAGLLLLLSGPVMVRLFRRSRQLEAQRAAERELIALGRMAAVVAHEIRNPLASLKGHAQLLEERLTEPRDLKKAARVVSEAQRLEGLVNGLLIFLRSQRIDPKPTQLTPLIETVLQDLGATERVSLLMQGAPATWPMDPDRMRQVFSNVLDNALEVSEDRPVEFEVRTRAKGLEISIRDRGPGLPAEQDIFAPFVTTKTHGTGLGLAVSRAIIAAHDGTIEAHAREGGGTEVIIEL